MSQKPLLGVIGGSGLYHFDGLENPQTLTVSTPFGEPSAPIVLGQIGNIQVAFLARHGIGHIYNPTEVNYRANIFALKQLGVRYVVSISACGSLRDDYRPGEFVIPDQVVDFTRKRKATFFEDGLVAHISSADPFCPELSTLLSNAAANTGSVVHKGGTFITIEGPRFSSRAESHLFRSWGISIIGMTTSPEVFLAREAGLCYAALAHITDYDVWHLSEESVTVEMIVRTLSQNTQSAQDTIRYLSEKLVTEPPCECEHALSSALITDPLKIPEKTREKLKLLIDPYLNK